MHPILARSRRLLVYLALFVPVAWLEAELLRFASGGDRFALWLVVQPALLMHAMSCLASFYLCRSLPLTPSSLPRVLLTQLGAALVAAGLVLGFTTGWAAQLEKWGLLVAAPVASGAALIFLGAFGLAVVAAASHYLYLALLASEEAERRAFELRLLAQEAELRALRAQLDPHFLFNSLNSINALIGAEPAKARKMCSHLADFLRLSLRRSLLPGAPKAITLREELALVESYLAVEQIRFGARLRTSIEVAPSAAEVLLPPLLLQPLVENALRHGIAHLVDGGELQLTVRPAGKEWHLLLRNDCDEDKPRGGGTGLGLANVRGRLAAHFGDTAQMRVEDGGTTFTVELILPAEETAS